MTGLEALRVLERRLRAWQQVHANETDHDRKVHVAITIDQLKERIERKRAELLDEKGNQVGG